MYTNITQKTNAEITENGILLMINKRYRDGLASLKKLSTISQNSPGYIYLSFPRSVYTICTKTHVRDEYAHGDPNIHKEVLYMYGKGEGWSACDRP